MGEGVNGVEGVYTYNNTFVLSPYPPPLPFSLMQWWEEELEGDGAGGKDADEDDDAQYYR